MKATLRKLDDTEFPPLSIIPGKMIIFA